MRLIVLEGLGLQDLGVPQPQEALVLGMGFRMDLERLSSMPLLEQGLQMLTEL